MSVLISIRRWERPDRPEPVYKGVLDLWEAPLYAPIRDATRSGGRTPDAIRDRTFILQTVPEPAYIITGAGPGPTPAVYYPALQQASGLSFRSSARDLLDVRLLDPFPPFGVPVPDATVDQQVPAWQQAAGLSYRSRDQSGLLDVRLSEWAAELGWLTVATTPTATDAQLWPAILENAGLSYRSRDRAALDVRLSDWFPEFGWLLNVATAAVPSWIPVFDAEVSFRTADGPRLDVRYHEWSPERGWIFSAIPVPATVAQQLPAILEGSGLSFRSPERDRLDVRKYEWAAQPGWLASVVDVTVAKWIPIFTSALRAERSRDRAPLNVKNADAWSPEFGWVFPVLPPVLGTPTITTFISWNVEGLTFSSWNGEVLSFTSYPAEAVCQTWNQESSTAVTWNIESTTVTTWTSS